MPAYPAPPAGVAPAPPAAARSAKLAIFALVSAGVGLIFAAIPFVTWFSGLFLLAGFVMGLIALIKKNQGGTGFSIAAVAVSVVGWILSIVMTFVSFGLISDATYDAIVDDYTGEIEGGAPYTDDSTEDVAGDAESVEIVESAFAQVDYAEDVWWYAVILDNPNDDYIFAYEAVEVTALDASGAAIDTATEYPMLLAGKNALFGAFTEIGTNKIAEIEIVLPDASAGVFSPADETGTLDIGDVTATSDEYVSYASGTVNSTFGEELSGVYITVIARDAAGAIIGGGWDTVETVPADGSSAPFEVMLSLLLTDGSSFEVYPSL
ncbi:hypothetical protein FHX49_000752 [Microbacterium endophyticum]|uniref:DUF4190 domain-containing protein n=1 Tax=Microbacterium endophyticum TaxID=1526412 RepID=A0A7W4V1M2_9MICO|nr:hypothetical protein [Microbacterium endophyticum]MBB2975211.1 hypothetical protein [Microbacterium endophyticum]NIK37577.1 hypothetical protein [Microbacterium endophyticum]